MPDSPVLGGKLLRLVTAGMYDNPLVLYREYLQNSADAIASKRSGGGCVRITIDPLRSRITILDDGPGLTPAKAAECLIDVGRSPKDPTIDRGFRGIGRLSGLAFAQQLHFTTRTRASDPPICVSWNARTLQTLDLDMVDARTAIQEATKITEVSSGEWPESFFQVTIDRVNRHAASTLLNEDTVRSYLGEVCPVPLSTRFPLAEKIREFLSCHTGYCALDIRVNDDQHPIKRPFNEAIPLTDQFSAPYETLETSVIPRPDSDEPAAVLWLAHTPYAGSISRRLGIRGLRARVGNLQVGTDQIFEHLFLEPRFNGWCVGEVHILDSRIVPNGRRDYFEPGPHLRNLENRIGAIAHQISLRCRRASSQRNKLRNISAAIQRLEAARDLVHSGYLLPADVDAVVERERVRIPAIRQTIALVQAAEPDDIRQASDLCDREFKGLDVGPSPALASVPSATLATVQGAFGTIARNLPPDSALELIDAILEQLRDGHTLDHAVPEDLEP